VSADIESSDAAPVAVFISYRRAEAAGWARALYERLAAEFGRANVFFDQASIPPGAKWAEQLHGECTRCTALIALIGPKWTETLTRHHGNAEPDYVRAEIEEALKAGDQKVIPALIDDGQVPSEHDLRHMPKLQSLLENQMVKLSASSGWDADVESLIARLKQMGIATAPDAAPAQATPAPEPATPEPPPVVEPAPPPAPAEPATPAAHKASAVKVDPPGAAHYDELAELMLDRVYRVVPFLGPGVNSCGRDEPWEGDESEYLPDSAELATYLAEQIGMRGIGVKEAMPSLTLASQDLAIKEGSPFLYEILKAALIKEEILSPDRSPGAVHHFLANLPKTLRELKAPESCQLIVTTNYDTALEQAFKKAKEPYDVAVYVPSRGTFLHIPYEGEPRQVEDPNQERCFPIVKRGWLERTVIMKIHGTIDPPEESEGSEDCVITEDDYIDYMKGGIESIVPTQLLVKLHNSRLLFLGHELDDWSLRVFLLRVFSEHPLSDTASWALQGKPSELDRGFWKKIGVEHFGIPLDEYVEELGEHLASVAAARQPQA
jgi:hypothetical protein